MIPILQRRVFTAWDIVNAQTRAVLGRVEGDDRNGYKVMIDGHGVAVVDSLDEVRAFLAAAFAHWPPTTPAAPALPVPALQAA